MTFGAKMARFWKHPWVVAAGNLLGGDGDLFAVAVVLLRHQYRHVSQCVEGTPMGDDARGCPF